MRPILFLLLLVASCGSPVVNPPSPQQYPSPGTPLYATTMQVLNATIAAENSHTLTCPPTIMQATVAQDITANGWSNLASLTPAQVSTIQTAVGCHP